MRNIVLKGIKCTSSSFSPITEFVRAVFMFSLASVSHVFLLKTMKIYIMIKMYLSFQQILTGLLVVCFVRRKHRIGLLVRYSSLELGLF